MRIVPSVVVDEGGAVGHASNLVAVVPPGHDARVLGRVMGRPSFIPTPGFALKLALGDMAELLTEGQRVMPKRTQQAGFAFDFPELEGALRDLLGRPVQAA